MVGSDQRSLYRLGLTTIEKALSTPHSMALGLYIYSAGFWLKHSQTLRPEYRRIKGHVIGEAELIGRYKR